VKPDFHTAMTEFQQKTELLLFLLHELLRPEPKTKEKLLRTANRTQQSIEHGAEDYKIAHNKADDSQYQVTMSRYDRADCRCNLQGITSVL